MFISPFEELEGGTEKTDEKNFDDQMAHLEAFEES